MLEVFGDFWTEQGNCHVLTTNGSLKGSGACVMGRGVALQAKKRFPGLPMVLGKAIKKIGNIVNDLDTWSDIEGRAFHLYSFPVKHSWFNTADLELIGISCDQLTKIIPLEYKRIIMVRPGCGNGGLNWETVHPICLQLLDRRFVIVEYKK